MHRYIRVCIFPCCVSKFVSIRRKKYEDASTRPHEDNGCVDSSSTKVLWACFFRFSAHSVFDCRLLNSSLPDLGPSGLYVIHSIRDSALLLLSQCHFQQAISLRFIYTYIYILRLVTCLGLCTSIYLCDRVFTEPNQNRDIYVITVATSVIFVRVIGGKFLCIIINY